MVAAHGTNVQSLASSTLPSRGLAFPWDCVIICRVLDRLSSFLFCINEDVSHSLILKIFLSAVVFSSSLPSVSVGMNIMLAASSVITGMCSFGI